MTAEFLLINSFSKHIYQAGVLAILVGIMRTKYGSLLIGIILLSGFVFPIIAFSTTTTQVTTPIISDNGIVLSATEIKHSWYHDGSNITGFASPVADLPTMGSLTSSGTYFYSEDLGTGSGWHGPAMTYTLEETFKVSQMTSIDIEIEFDCVSTTNRLGALNVILYDSNEYPLCRFIVSDAWADDRQMKLPFSWFYLNGSRFTTPLSEPDWVTFSPYYDTLSLTNTSTGFLATIPEIGAFDIPVHTTQELDRVVTYVTIRFLANAAWTYCEEVFIHSLNLEWVGEAIATTTPTTPTSATPPQTGVPWDSYLLPITIGGSAFVILVVAIICMKRRGPAGAATSSQYDW